MQMLTIGFMITLLYLTGLINTMSARLSNRILNCFLFQGLWHAGLSLTGTGLNVFSFQYLGTAGSISWAQARIPPLTLLRCLNPCWRRN
ncbi:hypothetical protein SBV1_820054 [Verrucomicrobia bacterium]|nr:hypothetical protein SBV1_820054 [Verrucomicrobiota bacterium]